MALHGYIGSNTYLVIDTLIYEKRLSRCTAQLIVYSDASKEKVVGYNSVVAEGSVAAPSIASVRTPLKNPPENPADSYYLIDNGATGSWEGCDGRIAKKSIFGGWDTYILVNNAFLLYVEEEKTYREYKDGAWVEVTDMTNDRRIWDKWFAPEVALAPGTNPTQQMYKFIKTLSLYKNCVNA
jgi:hypothetical protein